jgi:hypothetical protein
MRVANQTDFIRGDIIPHLAIQRKSRLGTSSITEPRASASGHPDL